jgi:hypothetical protein
MKDIGQVSFDGGEGYKKVKLSELLVERTVG